MKKPFTQWQKRGPNGSPVVKLNERLKPHGYRAIIVKKGARRAYVIYGPKEDDLGPPTFFTFKALTEYIEDSLWKNLQPSINISMRSSTAPSISYPATTKACVNERAS